MDDDVSYEPETLTYQARVEADGGEIIDLDAINDLYVAGIDSITLSFSNSYGLSKNANNKITKYFDLSDNDLDFAQSDTSKSPTYLESTLNGYSSASYDGCLYTHLRAHETPEHLVCRLLLEKKKILTSTTRIYNISSQ